MPANRKIYPPIPEHPTPNPTETLFRELVSRESDRFRQNDPVKRGTFYENTKGADQRIIDAYPTLYFLKETVPVEPTVVGMQQREFVVWNWATRPDAESAFNADISYLGDSVTNPVFARTYLIPRDDYDAFPVLPIASPLTGIIGIKIIAGGSNYTHASFTLRGNGSGAIVEPVINGGVITGAVIIEEGQDFDLNSFVDVIGDGVGAQVQLILQPVAAILTSQQKKELPESDPYSHEFVRVLRAYELLPGPYIPFTRYDENLGPVQGRRRAVLNQNNLGGQITATSKTNYEGRDGSSVISWEIQENWSDGTGVGFQNPPYPKLFRSTYEQVRGVVDQSSQIIVRPFFGAEATFSRAVAPGNRVRVTKTFYEPYADNPFLSKQIIETYIEPVILDFKASSEHGGGVFAITETTDEPGNQVLELGLLVTGSEVKTISPDEQVKHTEKLYGLPGIPESTWPILHGAHTDEKTGIVYNFTKQVIDAGSPVPARSGYRGPFVEDQPYDRWKTIRIITSPDCSTLPPDETRIITRPFSLPPTLLSVEAAWSDKISKTAHARQSAPDDNNSISVSVSSGSAGGMIVTRRTGFRGKARCIWVRRYKCGPFLANEVPTPLSIQPTSGSAVFFETESSAFTSGSDDESPGGGAGSTQYNAFSNAGGQVGDTFEQRVHALDISDHLVGNFAVLPLSDSISGTTVQHARQGVNATGTSGGGAIRSVGLFGGYGSWSAQMRVQIPLSSPTPEYLKGLGQILDDVELEELPFGIWVMHLFYIDLTNIAI